MKAISYLDNRIDSVGEYEETNVPHFWGHHKIIVETNTGLGLYLFRWHQTKCIEG